MNKGHWFSVRLCINCSKALSEMQRMYSRGRCPLCGFKHANAVTIVETKELAARRVTPWWQLWNRRYEILDEQ